jgi:hypothetical protein
MLSYWSLGFLHQSVEYGKFFESSGAELIELASGKN